MYCPEDGRHIPCSSGEIVSSRIEYPPCSWCGTVYSYDGDEGLYRVLEQGPGRPKQNPMDKGSPTEEILKAYGESKRVMALDALIGRIVDAMEKGALEDGTCTYYTGTYAVARETLITAGLTCEKDPSYRGLPPENKVRWVSFIGDDYEYITRRQAIETLLAERS